MMLLRVALVCIKQALGGAWRTLGVSLVSEPSCQIVLSELANRFGAALEQPLVRYKQRKAEPCMHSHAVHPLVMHAHVV
eukprot:1161653-Pelagomonas_calceolata.AAC.9